MTGLSFKWTAGANKYPREIGIPLNICSKWETVGGAARQYKANLAEQIKTLQQQQRKIRDMPRRLLKERISEAHCGPVTVPH